MAENKPVSSKSILIFVIILFFIIALLSVASYLSSVKNTPPVTVQSTEEPTSKLISEPTITPTPSSVIENPYDQSESKINSFLFYLPQNPLSDDIVNSDDALKAYFSKNLNMLSFTGISRGKFDKYSDKQNVILFFKLKDESGEGSLSVPVYIFILQKDGSGVWQISYQKTDTEAKQFDKIVSGFEIITNDHKQLVRNEPQFFMGSYDPITVGTCVSAATSFNIFRLEKGEFKLIWNTIDLVIDYGDIGYGEAGNTTSLETKVSFKDTDSDGNLEIIRQGTEEVLSGGCSELDPKQISNKKIYEIYKWNFQKQTFIKTN